MSPMITTDIREAVLAGAVAVLVLLLFLVRHRHVPPLPPAVAPIERPLEEQVRDVRHRVSNVEQQMPVVADHAIRMRTMEREVGEVRGSLANLKEGQERMMRHLDMLVEHHLKPEEVNRRSST